MTNVAVVGLGPIGISAAHLVRHDPDMRLAALVDANPDLAGTTPVPDGPPVTADAGAALAEADLAIICTASSLADLAPLLRQCCDAKTHAVSSCEEMLWPRYRHAALADELDDLARSAGVAMLGTGVNPGFALDFLPLVASFAVAEVSGVRAVRRVDARRRRRPLQAKVGATLTVDQFEHRRDLGTIGHRGMAGSVAMVVAGLGRDAEPGSVRETLEPVVADRELHSALGPIAPGRVAGMRNVGTWRGEGLSVELDLVMSVGWPEEYDEVHLNGPVPLRLRIDGGTPGDSATAAALVNAGRVLPSCRPGLRTMLDLGRLPSSRASGVIGR